MSDPYIRYNAMPTLAAGQKINIIDYFSYHRHNYDIADVLALNFRDNTVGGGYFEVNGVRMGEGSGSTINFYRNSSSIVDPSKDFLFSSLSSLKFVGGSNSSTDELVINGYIDGWGNIVTAGTSTTTVNTVVAVPTPTVEISASSASMNEGGSITYTVELSAPTDTAVRVYYSLNPGYPNPVDSNDWSASATYFYIPAGSTQGTVTITAANDGIYDGGDERFSITLTSVTGNAALGTPVKSYGTIHDNDSAPQNGQLSIFAVSAIKAEGDTGEITEFTFRITRTGGSDGSVSANWAINPISPGLNSLDFQDPLTPTTVYFGNGDSSTKYITIRVKGDDAVEASEIFSVNLTSPTGGATVGTGSATGQITNDDADIPDPVPGVFNISATNTVQNEGDSGTTAYTFEIARTGGSDGAVSVNWAVQLKAGGNVATADDFLTPITPIAVLFADGQTHKTITVFVRGDAEFEQSELFDVVLSNPLGGATIGTSLATGQILNDDADIPDPLPGTFNISATNAVQNEGDSGTTAYTFEIARTGGSDGAVSVNWFVQLKTGENAATADDFLNPLVPSTVYFANGETSKTVTVFVNGDAVVEQSEVFDVVISNPTGGATVGGTAVASGEIVNDDDTTIATSFSAPLGVGYTTSQNHNDSSQYYADKDDGYEYHLGEDWRNGVSGGDVKSAANGKVTFSGELGNWGNFVVIQHTLANGTIVTSAYAHLLSRDVSAGEMISEGDVLGQVGGVKGESGSGNSTGPHLHFSIYLGEKAATSFQGYSQYPDPDIHGNYVDPTWFINNFQNAVGGGSFTFTETSDVVELTRDADTVNALDGHDTVYALEGDDTVLAGLGNDVVFGGSGSDKISGGAGFDKLFGQNGNDILLGGNDHDLLNGGRNRDKILGGKGHDTINGGAGRDKLKGGQGADQFVYNANAKQGRDTILDFEDGIDSIKIKGGSFAALTISDLPTGFGAKIELDSGTVIRLKGIDSALISEDDFQFI